MKRSRWIVMAGAVTLLAAGGFKTYSEPTTTVSTTQSQPANQAAAVSPAKPATGDLLNHTAGQHLIVFVNMLQQTLWIAGTSNADAPPLSTNGWEVPAGGNASISVPDGWAGRFWGRTGCKFDSNGNGPCETGGCNNVFQCQVTGDLPATLAEFKMNGSGGQDYYDISLVDGSNVPLYINSFGVNQTDKVDGNGCSAAGCTHDVNAVCPTVLQVQNSSGTVVGCMSSCTKFGTPIYCCPNGSAYGSAATCLPATWPVNSAQVFKTADPIAYSYAFDDATSTLTCTECNYQITFGTSSDSSNGTGSGSGNGTGSGSGNGTGSGQGSGADTGPGSSTENALAQQLFNQINSDRATQGLPAYTWSSMLATGAYQHDVAMTTASCGLVHQCPNEPAIGQRVTNDGLSWTTCGENIGYTSPNPDLWTGIKQGIEGGMLAEQPPDDGHRQNLLSTSFHQIGVAVLIDAQGLAWVTEDFAN